MEIKKLSDYQSKKIDWNILLAAFAIVFGAAVSEFLHAEHLLEGIPLLVSLVTILAIAVTLILQAGIEAQNILEEYRAWIASQTLEHLRGLSDSMELDEDSRREIVSYLNTKHAGWSLSQNKG